MDCSTARLFLQLGRPGASRDLDAEEAAELVNHLDQCPACHQHDVDQRRLDSALGRAMLDVEVPSGLKEQIHLRLAADRGATHRRWGGRVFFAVAAAAAVVLVAWAAWLVWGTMRPTVAAESVAQDYNILRPGDKAGADELLKKLDLPPCSPQGLNYAYLTGAPAKAVLPGTEGWKSPVKVAQFVFAHKDQRAIVFAVPHRYANVERHESNDQGYTYSLDYDGGYSNYVCLILHTGKNYDWLKVADAQ